MNLKKILLFSVLMSIILVQAEYATIDQARSSSVYEVANEPYEQSLAIEDLRKAGYPIPENREAIVTRGNPNTGASFVDMVVSMVDTTTGNLAEQRAVCYGPGRYVLPHSHDEHENFHVKDGACTLWTLVYDEQGERYWIKHAAQKGDSFQIPARVIHCLLASSKGLCMHVPWNDRTRSVDFKPAVKAPFEQE